MPKPKFYITVKLGNKQTEIVFIEAATRTEAGQKALKRNSSKFLYTVLNQPLTAAGVKTMKTKHTIIK